MSLDSVEDWLSSFHAAAIRVKRAPSERRAGETDEKPSNEGGSGLERRLGLWDLILMGIGASIGSGIFVITGTVAQDAGPGVVFSFMLAGGACVLNALCYAELSSRFPALVGGAYLYTYATFNELTAFLVFINLIFDYHIGAASIIRSLANYLVTLLKLIPAMENIPVIFGPGGVEFFGGWVSINIVAPILLAILTFVLCQGIRESSIVNGLMTMTKIVIVLVVIVAGSFEIDVANWSPFFPNGSAAVIQGATVVFFAYVGFDVVANSAEESKRPQRDLPLGIMLSLFACAILYVGVCLVVTGMIPYYELDSSAPLATAFVTKGLTSLTILISIGAVAGLTTTVLVGLYVQSRLYLGLGRDGLLPGFLAKVNEKHHTPVTAQIWVGLVAGILALFIDVSHLSHILSVGCLTGYSVVSACVVVLRISPQNEWQQVESPVEPQDFTKFQSSVGSILATAVLGFSLGLCYRWGANLAVGIFICILQIVFMVPLYTGHRYHKPPGFACPAVPTIPLFSIIINMFLFAQLHYEAWIRFGAVSFLAVLLYAVYGQYHSMTLPLYHRNTPTYKKAPTEDVDESTEVES